MQNMRRWSKKKKQQINLLELVPHRKADFEVADKGNVVVIVPKFQRKPFNRLLLYMKRPNIRVNLDDIGSFIWLRCDGRTNVAEICDGLEKAFGNRVEPVRDRVDLFFRELRRISLIRMEIPEDRAGK